MEWVELQVSRNIIPAGGANVELYFAELIGYRADLTPQSAKWAMWALLTMNELVTPPNGKSRTVPESKKHWTKHRREDTNSTWLLL
jgi:hypothetical protein